MGEIRSEVLTGFLGIQERFWSPVALALSEQLGGEVKIPIPTVEVLPLGDLFTRTREPTIQLHFTFAEAPEELQLLLIGSRQEGESEIIQRMIKALTEGEQEVTGDAVLEVIRPFLEKLLQGLASAVTTLRGTPFTLEGTNLVYEPLTIPPNFLQADQVLEVHIPVVLREDEPPLPVSWILGENSACRVLGLSLQEGETDPLLSELPSPSLAPSVYEPSAKGMPEGPSTRRARSLDLLLDIPLEISVELGRVEMTIRDILELGTGSIIELPKAAGDPVEIMVNDRLIARGEVVVIDENFGVRVTEIISPSERVQRLGA